MSVNAVIAVKGINGNSDIEKNSIPIFSFSIGGSVPLSHGTSGKDSRSGKPDLSDLSVMKAVDLTTPYLFLKLTKVEAIAEVTLKYFKNINNTNEAYIVIKLTNAYISSQQFSGSSENPMESLSFTYDKIDFSFYKEKADKKGVELEATKWYDIRTNKAG